MLTLDALTARREVIAQSRDLSALLDRLVARARPVIDRMPVVPDVKALLSRDGGVCPDDQSPLLFDPWSPDEHTCPTCGKRFTGERHDAHWARAQHLWIAERAAHLATIHAITGDEAAGARARELLAAYYDRYFALPNSDNVLGPSHLFFSTYLESIWILNYIGAAFLLREVGALDDDDVERINAIADEAATIIAGFNEGMSNRQTWHAAALTAIATWFGDEDLAINSVEGRTGLLGHLADGFGSDGLWWEGDNYHLFALRGLMIGLQWSLTAGAELLADNAVAAHLGEALMAPASTALPDLTFPARKDSRYGVSLAHPAYVECWEAGAAMLQDQAPAQLAAWLRALYASPPKTESTYDSYLHDAGEPLLAWRTRSELSWWALLAMSPEARVGAEDTASAAVMPSRLLEQQQLAVLRHGRSYLSLECGGGGAGHGHPDRLHLTLHANGVHWLADPGTGAYVTRDLFWYRSTLAHNAPMLDGRDQPVADAARCEAFESAGEWAWATARWNEVQRSVVLGPRWAVDVVTMDAHDIRRLDVPWHLAADPVIASDGTWTADALESEFVHAVERLELAPREGDPGSAQSLNVTARAERDGATIGLWFAGDGDVLRAIGPGLPGATQPRKFLIRRARSASARMVTALDFTGTITGLAVEGHAVIVHQGDSSITIDIGGAEVALLQGGERVVLGGAQPPALKSTSYLLEQASVPTIGQTVWVDEAPALDGTLNGFRTAAPLQLDEEYQYFRSETPYPGDAALSAVAHVNWSADELYLAVDVTKHDLVMRPADAPPLDLDNEPDDVNADGIQVYVRGLDHQMRGWLVRPAPDGKLLSRPIGAAPGSAALVGAWQRTPQGYRITVAIPCPDLIALRRNERLGFDVIVNEMRPGRVRRTGMLMWSGGPGWVYLRGDRHDERSLGELELLR